MLPQAVFSQEIGLLDKGVQNISSSVEIFHDENNAYSANDLINKLFHSHKKQRMSLHDTKGQYWIRFDLENPDAKEMVRLVSLDYAHIKNFELYEVNNNDVFSLGKVSSETPLSERVVFSRFPALKLSIDPESKKSYLLNIHLLHVPLEYELKLSKENDYYSEQIDYLLFLYAIFGFLLALIAYNMSLYVSLLDSRYLYISLFASMIAFVVLGYDGLLYMLPWSPSVEMVSFILSRGSIIATFLWIGFMQSGLEVEKPFPRISKAADVVRYAAAVSFFLSIAFIQFTLVFDVVIVLVQFVSLYIAIRLYRQGSKAALYIAMAIIIPLIGAVSDTWIFSAQASVYDMSQYDNQIMTWLRQYVIYLSVVVSVFFMSWALAVFVRQVRDEKEMAQEESLQLLQDSYQLKDQYAHKLERDIAAATQKLRIKAEQLEQLDKYKSRFFANISHEFRTPLTLIRGPVDAFVKESYGDVNAKGKQALEICSRNIERLSSLIDELLLLAEVESGVSRLKAVEVDINQFLRRTAALFFHKAKEKNIRFIQDIPLDPSFTYIDASKFEKVIFNILSNAFKYTPQNGEIVLNVNSPSVHETDTGSFVEIQIADTGPGISDEAKDKIFDRFYRSEQADNATLEGTGIGLSLVQELTALHGGDVSVRNREAGGAVFVVNIPLGIDHLADNEILPSTSILPAYKDDVGVTNEIENSSGVKPSILLVEDNADMRSFVAAQFTDTYHVLVAENGQQALEVLAREPVSLILSDVMMPIMDGISLLEKTRDDVRWQHLPFVLLTAKAAEEDRLLALRAQADDYIAKPFNSEELVIRVENLLRRVSAPASNVIKSTQWPTSRAEVIVENPILASARNIILEHISDRSFGVDTLASALHMSRSTLQRRIEQDAEMTVAAFMRQIRLEQAHQYIVNKSHRTMAETAYAVGFNHPGYFSRLYKKYSSQLAPASDPQS